MSERTAGLRGDDLRVRFGGLTAVDGVSLRAGLGTITGLIGPNGAGKTTTFNALTGFVRLDAGEVHFCDHRVTSLSSARRARLGLGRTFQRMELCDTLSVADNVALGREAWLAGRHPWSQLRASRAERTDITDRMGAAMDQCRITKLALTRAADLSTGQRRLVELARAVATGFSLLLLDEPSSGLDVHETERFAEILREVSSRDGVGILLVEHDMALVRAVCAYTYVLDFGKLIHEGPTSEVLASDAVRAAYLGSEAVA